MNRITNMVQRFVKFIKGIYEKLGAFNIVWLISLVLLLVFFGDRNWQASFTEIHLYLDTDKTVESVEYDIQMLKDVSLPIATVDDNIVTVSVYNYGNKIESMELSLPVSEVECSVVDIYSRQKLLKEFECSKEDILIASTSDKTVLTFSEEFLAQLNSTMKKDWKLNVEVMSLVILLFVVIKLVELFFTRKWYKKYPYVCLLIFLLIVVGQYGVTTTKDLVYDLNLNGMAATNAVTSEETLYQTFVPTEDAIGVQIKFSTFGEELKGTYEIRIYDEAGNRVLTHEAPGSKLKDNEYYKVGFEDALTTGQTYKFTVVKTDTDYLEERLIMWHVWRDDIYPDGRIEDLTWNILVGDLDFDFYGEGVEMQKYLLLIVMIFFVLVLICGKANGDTQNFTKYAICIYAGVLLVFLSKVVYSIDYENLGAYDELAHISYVSYYAEHPDEFVPDYKNVTLLIPESGLRTTDNTDVVAMNQSKGVYYGKTTETINYLMHQPLYYKLLSFTRSVTSNGELVHVNLDRLRLVNIVMIVTSLLIVFYVGLTRIPKNLYYHLLYATMCTSLPLLYYMTPMINNDNLCFFAMAVYMLGIVRVSEGKRNFFSYLCIAAGIVIAALTKFTVFLLVAVISVFYVIRVFIKEKSVTLLWNKNFLMTLPVYALMIMYYLAVYVEYGTFRPGVNAILGEQAFTYPTLVKPVSERKFIDLAGVLESFVEGFLGQWSTFKIKFLNSTIVTEVVTWLKNLILLLPIALPVIKLKDKSDKDLQYHIFEGVSLALIVAIVYQFNVSISSVYGRVGRSGAQSRYYLCMLPMFAYAISYFVTTKINKTVTKDSCLTIGNINVSVDSVIHFVMCVCAFFFMTV